MRSLYKTSRQLMKLRHCHSTLPRTATSISTIQWRRFSSSKQDASATEATGRDIASIRAEMLARPPQTHSDMMYPINSYLLTKALSDFLPKGYTWMQQMPHDYVYDEYSGGHMGLGLSPNLPPGHHLVYFPLHLRGSELCPDGTDPYHSPLNTPFRRRMWAAGSIQGFNNMALDRRHAICVERIVNVDMRGSAGAEKVFVEVLREYMSKVDYRRRLEGSGDSAKPNPVTTSGFGPDSQLEHASDRITERRTLVFMQELSDEEKAKSLERKTRIVEAPAKPDYSVTITPTPTLLFHYSALTYNAHRIHLDRAYCREVEGHRDLLVHGPLSLTLMLCVLQSRLAYRGRVHEDVDSIDYRHLSPLYVDQPMRICVARRKPRGRFIETLDSGDSSVKVAEDGDNGDKETNKWDLWVENQDGSLCVKGTARTILNKARFLQ
ncbi:hypothetical protein F4777DRAFT_277182 [Nemania sp. FL0916]|nr:hypothetical protein F4777DRAFT_277182 [Nemania sp. FL0916]